MYDEAAALLADKGRRRLPYAPAFTPITPAPAPPVTAVDGSHAVLADTGAVWVVAWRAAAIRWPGPPPVPVTPRVQAFLPEEAVARVEAAYEAHGAPAPRIHSAEGAAEALRTLEEARLARARRAEGLLLIDGALEGLPPHAQALWAPLAGPDVLGVVKRSAAAMDGVPLLPRLRDAGRAALPGQAWSTPLPDGHACLLHPRALHAYRIDGDPDHFGHLAWLSRDAVYLGYPYPLAIAHNAVAFTAAVRDELRHGLEAAARRAGAAHWLDDPHALLDVNV